MGSDPKPVCRTKGHSTAKYSVHVFDPVYFANPSAFIGSQQTQVSVGAVVYYVQGII